MSVFGCASDEQFYLEQGAEWPSWAHGDLKKISINDLRRVWKDKKDMSYNEYLKIHFKKGGRYVQKT